MYTTGRIYSTSFDNRQTTVGNWTPLQLGMATPSPNHIAVHSFCLSQISEVGDAEEEMLLVRVKLDSVTKGSGFAGVEAKFDAGDATSDEQSYNSIATIQTGGRLILATYWNIRAPFYYTFRPGLRPRMAKNTHFNVEIITVPNDAITFGGYIIWEELG